MGFLADAQTRTLVAEALLFQMIGLNGNTIDAIMRSSVGVQ